MVFTHNKSYNIKMKLHQEIPWSAAFLRTASMVAIWVGIILSLCILWLWGDATATVGNFFAPYVNSAEASSTDPEALLLASLENNTRAPSEKEVARFDILLTDLQKECKGESREEITRAIVATRREISNSGKHISVRSIISAAQSSLPKIPSGSGSCIAGIDAFRLYYSL